MPNKTEGVNIMRLNEYPLRMRALHATRYPHMWTTEQLTALALETQKESD